MVRTMLFLTAALLLSAEAQAGTRDGRFAVEEVGRVTCSQFMTARNAKSPTFGRMMGFVEGYLTAANRYEPNTFDFAPWQTTAAFSLILQGHCTKNGKDVLVMAAQKLVEALRPQRLTDYSNLATVTEGKTAIPIYDAVLRQAQVALTKQGLYKGPANGRFSPEMKLALQNFQKAKKLTPSGLPDSATLWVLLNP